MCMYVGNEVGDLGWLRCVIEGWRCCGDGVLHVVM